MTNDELWAAIEKHKADNPVIQEGIDAFIAASEAYEATLPKIIITTSDSSNVQVGGAK